MPHFPPWNLVWWDKVSSVNCLVFFECLFIGLHVLFSVSVSFSYKKVFQCFLEASLWLPRVPLEGRSWRLLPAAWSWTSCWRSMSSQTLWPSSLLLPAMQTEQKAFQQNTAPHQSKKNCKRDTTDFFSPVESSRALLSHSWYRINPDLIPGLLKWRLGVSTSGQMAGIKDRVWIKEVVKPLLRLTVFV